MHKQIKHTVKVHLLSYVLPKQFNIIHRAQNRNLRNKTIHHWDLTPTSSFKTL